MDSFKTVNFMFTVKVQNWLSCNVLFCTPIGVAWPKILLKRHWCQQKSWLQTLKDWPWMEQCDQRTWIVSFGHPDFVSDKSSCFVGDEVAWLNGSCLRSASRHPKNKSSVGRWMVHYLIGQGYGMLHHSIGGVIIFGMCSHFLTRGVMFYVL